MSKHAIIMGIDEVGDPPAPPPKEQGLTIDGLADICAERDIPMDSIIRVSGGGESYEVNHMVPMSYSGQLVSIVQLSRRSRAPSMKVGDLMSAWKLDGGARLLGPTGKPLCYSFRTPCGGIRLKEVEGCRSLMR